MLKKNRRICLPIFQRNLNRVKLTIFNALIILVIGMMVVVTAVFMKSQDKSPGSYNYLMLGGLALEFLGTVWFVLSLYRRRKNP